MTQRRSILFRVLDNARQFIKDLRGIPYMGPGPSWDEYNQRMDAIASTLCERHPVSHKEGRDLAMWCERYYGLDQAGVAAHAVLSVASIRNEQVGFDLLYEVERRKQELARKLRP